MKTRNETACRITRAKDGGFAPHLSSEVAERLTAHCIKTGQNRTRFVEWCVMTALDGLEREEYLQMSKDALVDMILGRRGNDEVSETESE